MPDYDPKLVEIVVTRLSIYGLRTPLKEIAEGVLAAIDASGTHEVVSVKEHSNAQWSREIHDGQKAWTADINILDRLAERRGEGR